MRKVQQILVAIDRSAMAGEALQRAISIAEENRAQLIVMHVIEPLFMEAPYAKSVDKDNIRQQITEEIDRLNSQTHVEYMLFIESGPAAGTIRHKAEKMQVDLLVVGSHGKEDIRSNYFGSTTLKLIQRTHIPVLIVKNKVERSYQEMIAPTNLSDYSKESIRFANALFTQSHKKYLYAFETISDLQAMTYQISNDEAMKLRAIKTKDAAEAFKKFVTEVGEGEMELIEYGASINEDLLAYITKERADLLVLGSKGIDNLNSFVFGSTASYLVQRASIDILVYVPSST
ncbi:universal stress protein [Sulfurimonas sp. HSL3-7]|uniref:universal stress protein n=1 Tax=Sulfonitrofixus jiaomeiensis TaxID=3131938 RepID=UPI0031F76DF4